jgi:hypothetical protein
MRQGGIPDFKFDSSSALMERGSCMDFYLKSGNQEGTAVAWKGSLFVVEALQHIPLRHAQHRQNSIFPVTFLIHTPAHGV